MVLPLLWLKNPWRFLPGTAWLPCLGGDGESRLFGGGDENMAANVFRCLLFMITLILKYSINVKTEERRKRKDYSEIHDVLLHYPLYANASFWKGDNQS